MRIAIGGCVIELVLGDVITREHMDAIVNAANAALTIRTNFFRENARPSLVRMVLFDNHTL